MKVLDIKNLNVFHNLKNKKAHIVNDVSFSVEEGQCLCILGESGSGKSITMKAIMGLLDRSFTVEGNAYLKNEDIIQKTKEELRKIRGNRITMILQNPMMCFDSLYRIEYQIKETLMAHTNLSQDEIYNLSIEVLNNMHINNPEEVMKKYPYQLSGGMLQRIMIAIALMLEPEILVADEPTTAIDAITQFEVMKQFRLLKERKTTMIFITHDLGVASIIADKVIVMNKGQIVDKGTFNEICNNPKDPYTKLLIQKRSSVMESYKKVMGVINND